MSAASRVGAASARARRAWATFRGIHRETGSLRAALVFSIRYARMKLPVLLGHVGAAGRREAVAEDIRAARAALAPGRALVAVLATGGLGDYIVIARFVRDLGLSVDGLAFDVYASTPANAAWIFAAVPGFRASYHDILFAGAIGGYDLALRVNQTVTVEGGDAAAPPRAVLARLSAAARRIRDAAEPLRLFIDSHPNMDNFLAQKAVYSNASRLDFLHRMAGVLYGGHLLPIGRDPDALARLGLARVEVAGHGLATRRYVTIHNGFDPGFIITNERATKCYPHFDAVVRALRGDPAIAGGIMIVQVGTSTSTPIPGVDLDLIGRTNLREVAEVLAGALLHIDNEGGLVHLARCYGVPACVVFGPTPSAYFGYPGNLNIDPSFCGGCWWINQTWMDYCPRGFPQARCMTEQDPLVIAQAIGRFLVADGPAADAGRFPTASRTEDGPRQPGEPALG
jgi:hypothetical protein